MYKAVAYIRLSRADGDEGESNSVTNQRQIIQNYANTTEGIQLVSEKVDDGYSGIIFDRPAFQEMMTEIECGEINCVIVKDMSRLGRHHYETVRHLRHIFPAYGVRFISIIDGIDTLKDKCDGLIVSVRSILNDAYCSDISTKTRAALEAKRKKGDYVGAAPVFGYIKDPANHNQLVPDPYASQIVRDIFRLKIDGMSARGIAKELNEQGVLSPIAYKRSREIPVGDGGFIKKSGTQWTPTAIFRILTNEIYTGVLAQGKRSSIDYKIRETILKPESDWIRVENTHEAIIPRQDFEITQQVMKLDTRVSSPKGTVHPFSGLLICGSCGGPMVHKTNKSKGHTYYYFTCQSEGKRGCPESFLLPENPLTEAVLTILQQHIGFMVDAAKVFSSTNNGKILDAMTRQYNIQIKDIEKQLGQNMKYKKELYENLINDRLSKSEYKILKSKYEAEEERLQGSKDLIAQYLVDAEKGTSKQLAFIKELEKFKNVNKLDRRTVVHLIKSITIFNKDDYQIDFSYQKHYDLLTTMLHSEKQEAI